MINPKELYFDVSKYSEFVCGVPDSLLKELNSCLLDLHPRDRHIIAPNEGICIGLAIGNYIATSKTPTIYMQNSGIGNAINPLISLADQNVYGIPMVVFIGWRGEPGIKDEPQHYKQGLIQEDLLRALDLEYFVIDSNTVNYRDVLKAAYGSADKDKSPKVVLVRKDTFERYLSANDPIDDCLDSREDAIAALLDAFADKGCIVSTTGKASRELFELRSCRLENHDRDFLTVGGMGHASSIAVGLSMNTNKRVICIDGDGALLMHMGSLVSSAKFGSKNFIHVVLNNGVHESVGGQPTLIDNVNVTEIAKSCGYKKAISVKNSGELKEKLTEESLNHGPTLLEYIIKPGSRNDLGRPSTSPSENLSLFMKNF